jgi:arylsulfatase A-like enzyme
MKRWIVIIAGAGLVGLGVLWFMLRPGPRCNVVLVSIDTLRPDELGCYGNKRDVSPAIDRLAREGTRFETAVSSTSWTLPAHVALLTSLPDLVHGVLWDTDSLDPKRITLAQIMKDNGYRTAGVFTGPYLLPRFGFARGFEEYMDATRFDKKLTGPAVLVAAEQGRTTPGALDRAISWLAQDDGRPFFLFLHLFDAHPDFDPPPPYDTMFDPDYHGSVTGKDVFHNPAIKPGMAARDLAHLRALYDGEIRFVDEAGISRLVKYLEDRGILDRTLVVVTSDHGEEFFEHGEFGHRNNLFDATLRIPLLMRLPGKVPAGLAVKSQVRIIDIMPTILDLVGLPQSPEGLGQSMVPFFTGQEQGDERPDYAELIGGPLHFEALRTGQSKLILDFKKQQKLFFDLESDPGELKPLTDPEVPGFKDVLKRSTAARHALLAFRKTLSWGGAGPQVMDLETRERLRSLGYVDN